MIKCTLYFRSDENGIELLTGVVKLFMNIKSCRKIDNITLVHKASFGKTGKTPLGKIDFPAAVK